MIKLLKQLKESPLVIVDVMEDESRRIAAEELLKNDLVKKVEFFGKDEEKEALWIVRNAAAQFYQKQMKQAELKKKEKEEKEKEEQRLKEA